MKPSLTGALCGRHPGAAAVDICTRCGTFLCADCVLFQKDEQPFCADCLAHLSNARPSRRSKLGLALSIGGVAGLLLGPAIPLAGLLIALLAAGAGLAGLVVSWIELRAIRRGEAPAAGTGRARAGRIIGLVHLALVALAVAGAFLLVRFSRNF